MSHENNYAHSEMRFKITNEYRTLKIKSRSVTYSYTVKREKTPF